MLSPSDRALSLGTAVALVAAYAVASHVRLYVGAGYAMPTQLVLVPMLFWLPVPAVPLLVAAALVVAVLPDVLRGQAHPERALTAVADATYALGPALVLLVAGEPAADTVSWAVVAVALAAQCAVDLLGSIAREWLGRGIAPTLQLRVIVSVYLIDACLTPVALLAAAQGRLDGAAIVAAVPLLGLLAAFAHDRRARIDELTSRLDELQEERGRLDAAIRRVGEASGAGLDRPALLDLLLRTAVDALGAQCGRARAGACEAAAGADEQGERAMEAAVRAASRSRRMAFGEDGDAVAVASPLKGGDDGDLVAVARPGRGFADEEAVAGAVREVVRSTDVPARYGGEELAVVLPDTDLDGAFAAGEQIRRAVEAVRVEWPGGAPLRVTVSVGVAAGEPQAPGAALIAAADAALYAAKRGGRNRTARAGEQGAARFAR